MILERLGSIIQGQQDSVDSNVLYTVGFESRHFARVRGVMSAITRPASVASLISKYNFQEKLFFSEWTLILCVCIDSNCIKLQIKSITVLYQVVCLFDALISMGNKES